MLRCGIVGVADDKLTPDTREQAKKIIVKILTARPDCVLVSGGCHLGGIDIIAESIADDIGVPKEIFKPSALSWGAPGGYKERNLKIAQTSDIVHVIVVREYPPTYKEQQFPLCYHCKDQRPPHVKSGACWTAIQAQRIGKPAEWHII